MVDKKDFSIVFNHDYLKLDPILNPPRPFSTFWIDDLIFIKNVIASIARYGIQSLRAAILLGQQSNPAGLYFTGRQYQPETLWMQNFLNEVFSSYQSVLFIDMHTGYGPRDQMSLVNSPFEKRKPDQLIKRFPIPLDRPG